jgi:flagellar hook-associated protein 1 FlgK
VPSCLSGRNSTGKNLMWNFETGLSGLDAARKALDVIGNNIANAATEGYHRQRIDLVPAYSRQEGGVLIGSGVEIQGVTRMLDRFLELEILRQNSVMGQVSQESEKLSTIESAFGELSGGTGLSASIDTFFNSLRDLSANPDQVIYQNEVLTAGEEMAGRFRTLGDFLDNLQNQIKLQAGGIVDEINALTTQIASLNDNIQRIEMSGAKANNLVDQRDQLISQLSQLAAVQTQERDFGVVDVEAGGIPVVTGAMTIQLEAGLNENGLLGITPAGVFNYQTTVEGGELGGLLALYNSTISGVQDDLDTLANAIMRQVNQYHSQGVGADGSFTELAGAIMTSENLSDIEPPLSDGSLFIRVIDAATGEVTRHQIDIDVSSDTLTTVAASISAITGLNASVSGGRLKIMADAGYEFDFLPAVLSEPTDTNFTATTQPSVSVSGIYTGDTNQTFTFTAVGSGSVGNGTLQLEVRDGDGNLVDTLNIGAGYAAGDLLDFDNGFKVAISAGDLNDGDTFEVDAFASTDTSGLLAATGINTFFAGTGAAGMRISDNVAESPGRIATALGGDFTDNANILRLVSIGSLEINELDSLTVGQFYRKLVTDIGQQLSIKDISKTNVENLMQTLNNRQSEISGVDINEEAAQMLVFEQMFQAMAKYLTTVNSTLTSIMNIVQ